MLPDARGYSWDSKLSLRRAQTVDKNRFQAARLESGSFLENLPLGGFLFVICAATIE